MSNQTDLSDSGTSLALSVPRRCQTHPGVSIRGFVMVHPPESGGAGKASMIIVRAMIPVDRARRETVRRSLVRILEPLRAVPGCLRCGLFQDMDDPDALLFVEEWADLPSLMAHARSDAMRVLLSALESARSEPSVDVLMVNESHGLDFIASIRRQADV